MSHYSEFFSSATSNFRNMKRHITMSGKYRRRASTLFIYIFIENIIWEHALLRRKIRSNVWSLLSDRFKGYKACSRMLGFPLNGLTFDFGIFTFCRSRRLRT
jgi:hypothetical protein